MKLTRYLLGICLLVFSAPSFSGVGDKYICDVVKRPLIESDNVDTGDTSTWSYKIIFLLDWATAEEVSLKRINVVDKKSVKWSGANISGMNNIPVSMYWGNTKELMTGFTGRKHNALGDIYLSFDEGSGRLLMVDSWGSATGSVEGFFVYVWHLSCIQI